MRRLMFSVAVAGLLAACSPGKPTQGAAAPATPPYNTTLDVPEIMGHIVDPASFAVWHASGDVVTAKGTQSLVPTTDEGWATAENGAAQIAEAGNLLMLPGRARDNGDWIKYARQLTEAGLAAKAATEAKDGKQMFVTGAQIYDVCTACHMKYYLPFVGANGKVKYPPAPKTPG